MNFVTLLNNYIFGSTLRNLWNLLTLIFNHHINKHRKTTTTKHKNKVFYITNVTVLFLKCNDQQAGLLKKFFLVRAMRKSSNLWTKPVVGCGRVIWCAPEVRIVKCIPTKILLAITTINLNGPWCSSKVAEVLVAFVG